MEVETNNMENKIARQVASLTGIVEDALIDKANLLRRMKRAFKEMKFQPPERYGDERT